MTRNDWKQKEDFSFDDFVEIVKLLRSPEGCPWDREQTHTSLRNNFVEEAYEVCEGIDKKDNALLCEELGDVLLQVVFHTGIAEDEGAFSMKDVLRGISKKMILRHPHVFSGIPSENPLGTWEEIKRKEKGEQSLSDTLSRISTSLPALKRAEKFIKKSAPEPEVNDDPMLAFGEEFYALCKRARRLGIDPEEALNRYLSKILEKCTNCE